MLPALSENERRIGLLAGWGRFPVVVAETLQKQGYHVYCLGVRDHADPVLRDICHHFAPLGAAQLGGAIRYYRRHHVKHATRAGKYFKVRLLGRLAANYPFPWRL